MRKALGGRYGDKPVALGGVFQIVRGKAKLHIMVGMHSETVDLRGWANLKCCVH